MRYLNERALTDITSVASGQSDNRELIFGLFDHYGNLYTVDNLSQLFLQVAENSNNNVNVKLSGTTSAVASGGIYTLTNFTISAQPGTDV